MLFMLFMVKDPILSCDPPCRTGLAVLQAAFHALPLYGDRNLFFVGGGHLNEWGWESLLSAAVGRRIMGNPAGRALLGGMDFIRERIVSWIASNMI